MKQQEELGLNEALVSVRQASNQSRPIELYHRTEECFGCPLDRLAGGTVSAESPLEVHYKLDASYNLQLELRKPEVEGGNSVCRFDNLALNSHAHYRIEVLAAPSTSSNESMTGHEKLSCKFETIDSGDCLLCPFAILVCILFAFMALEWVFVTFVKPANGRNRHNKLSSSSSSETSTPPGAGIETTPNPGPGTTEGGASASNVARDAQDVAVVAAHTLELAASASGSRKFSAASRLERGLDHTEVNSKLERHSDGARRRIECLDAFRGLTIAGMIFVNYGGAGYAMWEHKPWNGITLADFVFPFFIFSMGASIAISVRSLMRQPRRCPQGSNGGLLEPSLGHATLKIARRSTILMLLGIFLNSSKLDYDKSDALAHLRLTGVLQRFAISYFAVASLYAIELSLHKWIKAQSLSQVPYLSRFVGFALELLMAANYAAVHIYVTYFYQFNPNCPVGYTGPGGMTEAGKFADCTGGAAAWLDRLVLGDNHLYNDHQLMRIFKTQVSHDPEGILGYTTSILLALIGLQCGKILLANQQDREQLTMATVSRRHKSRLLALGQLTALLALGCLLTPMVPINKRLWSLTFVFVTAAAACSLIMLLYTVIDIYGCKKSFLLRLLISAGKNPIFLYVGHSLVHTMLPWWLPVSDPSSHLQLLLRLAWATLIWLLIAHHMARKGLFIRV